MFQPSILSQMRLAWQRLALAAAAIATGLGPGLTGRKPVLLRPERARLALQLGLFEALLRRLLLLEAARLGPLALKPRRAGPPAVPPAGSEPARADDLVPAGRLITRRHAVTGGLTAPAPLIRALRRRMACRWRPMLAPALPPALQSSRLDRDEARALRGLHEDAILIDAALNSS